ncbi:Bromodomain and WD repeat-containing protein 3 [Operophtera brumata]|uniref:Bromodomain and WD repeat-containing protein 3 n=1 Tax=Operophtera brumata TaxID=104452 RepID=A0A0L7LAY3_OPEBR|nr:Bromodomain and WD repeat-containing protein 3 [Operophtera brumata]
MGDHCVYFRLVSVGGAAYRPGEWLTSVAPRKAPYHPQMGDHCVYFRLVSDGGVAYRLGEWLTSVVPRKVPYHPQMGDHCVYFRLVSVGGAAYRPGEWLTSVAPRKAPYHPQITVLERGGPSPGAGPAPGAVSGPSPGAAHAAEAAAHFLSLRVRWDNGEVERLSPWDLEPLDPERLPAEAGGAVAVLPHELEAVLYKAEPDEWPPRGERAAACRAIAQHIGQAEVTSIDLGDARCGDMYSRSLAGDDPLRGGAVPGACGPAALPHVREGGAVPHRPGHHTRQIRQLDRDETAAAPSGSRSAKASSWRSCLRPTRSPSGTPCRQTRRPVCSRHLTCILMEIMSSADAESFRSPVSPDQASDYHTVVASPMDLGTVAQRLARREFSAPSHFLADMRRVFANSRLYNTNKRSRVSAARPPAGH